MNIKRRVKDAIPVLLGNKIAIGKETSIYEIVGWKYDIVKPSYKEIYSEISTIVTHYRILTYNICIIPSFWLFLHCSNKIHKLYKKYKLWKKVSIK